MKKFIIAIFFVLGIIPNFNGSITLINDMQAQMMAYEIPSEDDCFGEDTGLGYGFCPVCSGCYDARYDSCPWCGGKEEEDPLKDYDTCLKCREVYRISDGHKCTYSLCLDCGIFFAPKDVFKHSGHHIIK